MLLKTRYAFVLVFILLLYIVWVRCSDDVSYDSDLPPDAVEEISMNLTANTSASVVSIEYTDSTDIKCKYLTDYAESFDLDTAEGMDQVINTNNSTDNGLIKYNRNKFKNIKIFFPLRDPKVNGTKIEADIQWLEFANFFTSSPNIGNTNPCYAPIIAGKKFSLEASKEVAAWRHFLDNPGDDQCYNPIGQNYTLTATIRNYKKESCSISFELTSN